MNNERLYEKIWRELPNYHGYYGNIYGDVVSMKSYRGQVCRPMKVYGKEPNQYVKLQSTNCQPTKVYIRDVAQVVQQLGNFVNFTEDMKQYRGLRRSSYAKYNDMPDVMKNAIKNIIDKRDNL